MGKHPFEKPSLDTARTNLRKLFDAFTAETGIPATVTSEIVADDRAFVSRVGRSSLSFVTYDRVVGRFSWIWPKGCEWPAGIPRFAPVKPNDKALAKMRERQAKQATANTAPTLPGDAAWPSDIPKPGETETVNMEARNG